MQGAVQGRWQSGMNRSALRGARAKTPATNLSQIALFDLIRAASLLSCTRSGTAHSPQRRIVGRGYMVIRPVALFLFQLP